ncbi:glucans biosynthesis glucosyltransferase MdoH [Rhizobiales bacterium RZME27]|uniref:Glucans biosynthesis glucosyltransferase H n=1 Tax=Endobacterium cereale TaxID=2663029 RepID=A0A6A8AJZ8_9HYPH|nr:glucans biosynthesis glucosyltransferase MdoH [Endobacterium cereale]MEB2847212.1 glucans biosynthesis glucosyltransferase MdoH [Endobacterium cereale]MQY49061.1 glucans biosynthesis glucosyltransferase MdoH [Endobacterium cereale]
MTFQHNPAPSRNTLVQDEENFHSGTARYAGLPVSWRRLIVLCLNVGTILMMGVLVYSLLSPTTLFGPETIILIGFFLATPWTVLGFWNAVIGLLLLHGPGNPARSVYPFYADGAQSRPHTLKSRTALIVFLRNEDPRPVFERLDAIWKSMRSTGFDHHFQVFCLSDTSDQNIAQHEEHAFRTFADLVEQQGNNRPIYRRRLVNTGYKAGNVEDFLREYGGDYDFFLPLDSDSVMSGDVVVKLVAAMEQHPEIGILQTLVVGMPATSGFARMFQFGMRHGMRSFTMGSAWWNADCGAYWGHNALIRTEAFLTHCRLPVLPGSPPLGGHVLSHDQLEAAFMRRGGYEVRVLPIETRSYEANPPTLIEFARRDLRWCQGNMQYWRFLFAPGLEPVSRFQILQAILMYMAPPAWIAMTFAATWKGITSGFAPVYMELGFWLFISIFLLSISPKIAGAIDVVFTRGAMRSYGGPLRFTLSVLVEVITSMLMAPIIAVYITIFLFGLLFGRSVTWSGQNRDQLGVSLATAVKAMAVQTIIGITLAVIVFRAGGLVATLWALPFIGGLCVAVPFTMATASEWFGRLSTRLGLFAIPEESHMPRVLSRIVPDDARRWRRPIVRKANEWPQVSKNEQTAGGQ